MKKKRMISILVVPVIVLSACNSSLTSSPTAVPTSQIIYLPTVVTPTPDISPTGEVSVETATPTPTFIPLKGELPDISQNVYLDNRSTAASLMLSFFNAINRHEYLRAYSYYGETTELGTLEEFSNGYAGTESVSVVIDQIFAGVAAGNLYMTVPMVLNATDTTGSHQKFAACYVLHLPQPANYGSPPIQPMHIERGTASSIALSTSDTDALGSACPEPDYPTKMSGSPAVIEDLGDISSANYIDNRSDALSVMSSYLNAINLRQYVRAYSYWQTAPGQYEDFAAGFETTKNVSAQFGSTQVEAGAGQLYYSLPMAMRAEQTDGTVKTYAGCYVMHLAQPAVQATPPFEPLGIMLGNIRLTDNDADLASLVPSGCK